MAMVFPGGPVEIHYLFVDGGCLRSATRAISERYTGSATEAYFQKALRAGHSKIFYYDAVPAQDHNEEREAWIERISPQTTEFAKIRSLAGFHVQLGDLRGRAGHQRQKRVDVQIAVDMLLHTFRGNMARSTLLAGDIDFQPLLEALIREGMFVDLLHPQHASAALVDAADSGRVITAPFLAAGLKRSNGTPLLASPYDNIRPRGEPADLMHAWSEDRWGLELRRIHHEGTWLLERFDPAASATSLQFRGQHLKAVMATANDTHAITGDASVSELIQRFDGGVR